MSAHPKSKWNRLKLFRLLVNTFLASPEPRLMHERPVRRIHQPDDSLVHMRRQIARQVSALVSLAERSQLRYRGRSLGQSRRGRIHVHPNVAVALLAEVMPGKDPLRLQFVLARQRWNLHALPAASIELPAVISALQVLSVKPSVRERDAPVRTGIAHRKRLSLVRPSQHQGHFQQHRRGQPPPPYLGAARRRIPKSPQKSGIRCGSEFFFRRFFFGDLRVCEFFFCRHSAKPPCGSFSRANPREKLPQGAFAEWR